MGTRFTNTIPIGDSDQDLRASVGVIRNLPAVGKSDGAPGRDPGCPSSIALALESFAGELGPEGLAGGRAPAPTQRDPRPEADRASTPFNTRGTCLHQDSPCPEGDQGAEAPAQGDEKSRKRKAVRWSKLFVATKEIRDRLDWEVENFGDRFGKDELDVVDRDFVVGVPQILNSAPGVEDGTKGKKGLLERLLKCKSYAYVCENGHLAVNRESCYLRICPMCDAQKSDEDFYGFTAAFNAMDNPRMVTLTVGRCNLGSLTTWLSEIVSSFQKLRRRKDIGFLETKGGLWRLEIVPKEDGYHVHLHVLIDGWIENRNEKGRPLETAWAELTTWSSDEDRRSVNIDRVKGLSGLRESLKYVLKGHSASSHDKSKSVCYPDDWPALSEIATALRGRKVGDCWGSVRDILDERKEEKGGESDDEEPLEGTGRDVNGNCAVCGCKMDYMLWGDVAKGKVPAARAPPVPVPRLIQGRLWQNRRID